MKILVPMALCLAFAIAPVCAFAGDAAWGSMAVDTVDDAPTPYYGIGGGATEQEAAEAALSFCKEAGGENCTTAMTYQGCGALASNGKTFWAKAPSKEEAEKLAMSACKGGTCTILASDCN